MPIDSTNRFWVRGPFQGQTISRMSRASYTRAKDSSRYDVRPYPLPSTIMERMELKDAQVWYRDSAPDLHQKDFLWVARMQTARRLTERRERNFDVDPVLERLLMEGTFDRRPPDNPNSSEELAMAHSSAMVQRLLMRVEVLEQEVCPRVPF